MRLVARLLAGSALFLFGCGFAHNAGVVVTAPIRLFHHPSPTPVPQTTTVVATTTHSTGRAPAHPQPSPVTALSPHRPTHYVKSASPSPTNPKTSTVQATAAPKPKLIPAAPAAQSFPTAKPVPDKPGYVFSPSEPGKYVDVSGYPPGSKVKDPYSGKIFLVP